MASRGLTTGRHSTLCSHQNRKVKTSLVGARHPEVFGGIGLLLSLLLLTVNIALDSNSGNLFSPVAILASRVSEFG